MKFNLRGEDLVNTVKDILSKPFKPAKTSAKAATATPAAKMAPFKATTAADQKLYDEYEALCKRKDISKIAKLEAQVRFVLDHNTSPVAPYILERDFLNILDKSYNQRLSNALSPVLKNNAYAKSYCDKELF